MDGIASRSMLYMKHKVFVWTDCSMWNEYCYSIKSILMRFFFSWQFIQSTKFKLVPENCFPQWILKRLQRVSCGWMFLYVNSPYTTTPILWFKTYRSLHRNQMGRGRQLQVVMFITLVMTMEWEITHPCVLLGLFCSLSFLMCIVNCHLTSGCSEWYCETSPDSELLVKNKL